MKLSVSLSLTDHAYYAVVIDSNNLIQFESQLYCRESEAIDEASN